MNKTEFLLNLNEHLESLTFKNSNIFYIDIFLDKFKIKAFEEYLSQNKEFSPSDFQNFIQWYDIKFFNLYIENIKKYLYFDCKEYLNNMIFKTIKLDKINYKQKNVSIFIENLISYKIYIEEIFYYINSFQYFFDKQNTNHKNNSNLKIKKSYFSILLITISYFEEHLWKGVNLLLINNYIIFYILILNLTFGNTKIINNKIDVMNLIMNFAFSFIFKLIGKKLVSKFEFEFKNLQLYSILNDYNNVFPNLLKKLKDNKDFIENKYFACCNNFNNNKVEFNNNYNLMQKFITKINLTNQNSNIKEEFLKDIEYLDKQIQELNIEIQEKGTYIKIN